MVPDDAPENVCNADDKSVADDEQSPIEEVALTVPNTDDPSLPALTFRTWTIGLVSCIVLSFINMFFGYRAEPLTISSVTAQILALPIGRFMAAILPSKQVRLIGTNWKFSLNPGPFNVKEHVLITIFANAGAGGVYAVHIVTSLKAFYKREINFFIGLLVTLTTQILGFGFAGIFRKFLIEPAQMWWPANLVQVSLFWTLHEREERPKGGLTRLQFFLLAFVGIFAYQVLPGFLFPTLTCFSWVCYIWKKSVLAQQLGSGTNGFGLGAVAFDWNTVAGYLGSPLAYPFFAIANTMVGYAITLYIIIPLVYWKFDIYGSRKFPVFSSKLFDAGGHPYNTTRVINSNFQLDVNAYNGYSRLHIGVMFLIAYGIGFATLASSLSHVLLFHGRDIWNRTTTALAEEKPDIHTRLMQKYKSVPNWWFLLLLVGTILVSIVACELFNDQLQLRWWGLLLAVFISLFFTLPIGIITATTNQQPGLNIITEYIIGYLYPGRPIANVCFKTYGYISMSQAISLLGDFKLGHYMKIPPRSMFTAQLVGTIVAATAYLATAWLLLETVPDICNPGPNSNSPWTCPGDTIFYGASVIWGLIGPKRIFGTLGLYKQLNWCFLFGFLSPFPVYFLAKKYPQVHWLRLIIMPILISGANSIPPAGTINYHAWFVVGFIFNYYIFKYHKSWWKRYNYILSAALDGGLAFFTVIAYVLLTGRDKNLNWWGSQLYDQCPLSRCPTAHGINVHGCPVF